MSTDLKSLGRGNIAILGWLVRHRDQAQIVMDAVAGFQAAKTVRQKWEVLKPVGDVIADDIDELVAEGNDDAKMALVASADPSFLQSLLDNLPTIIAIIEQLIEIFTTIRNP